MGVSEIGRFVAVVGDEDRCERERLDRLRRRWREDAEGKAYRDWEPAPKR